MAAFYNLNHIPADTLRNTCISFGAAFVLRTLIRGNPKSGLIAGVLSATATLIHGLVTPIFRKLYPDLDVLTWEQEFCRGSLGLIGAAALGFVAFRDTNIFKYLYIDAIIWGWRASLPNHQNLNNSRVIILYPPSV